MPSLDGALLRKALARDTVGQVTDDTSVAIRLRYVGSGSVTSVTVTTATNIVMVTSDGGTDTYAFATYTTVGALVDAINADGIFVARVLDTIRSEATASQFVDGALTITSAGNYDVMVDTSAADYIAYRLTYDRSANENFYLLNGHRVTLKEIVYNITFGGGVDANGIKVYEINPVGNVETVIYQITPVDATATTINWASGEGGITAKDGNDLVVYISDATSVTGTLTVSGILE